MTRFLIAAMALLLVHCGTACAADQDCMPVYYRTKAPHCVDEVLSQLAQAGAKSEPSTSIGFLAQLFVASPGEKQRILDGETSDRVRAVQLVALFRAGLRDDARLFAEKSRLSAMLAKLEAAPPPPLSAVEPSSTPGDNDLLIGAYMASGDAALIQRILDNFSRAEDGMASDAMRMGYMNSKFGPTLTPQGREENVMARAGCAKYQCRTDPAKFLRVLTLSSAFWALQSLGQSDEGIRKTFVAFFDRDARLKNLLAGEQAAFSHYATALVLLATFKPDQPSSKEAEPALASMSKAALAYENLEPARDVFSRIEGFVKSGKQPK